MHFDMLKTHLHFCHDPGSGLSIRKRRARIPVLLRSFFKRRWPSSVSLLVWRPVPKQKVVIRREPILNLWRQLPYSGSMNLKEILADPSISFWLKDAIKTAYERDPVVALRDARWLLKMLGDRYTQIVNRDLAR
jgi:hypothetical protein